MRIEFADGPTDVGDKSIISVFGKYPAKNKYNDIDKDFEAKNEVKKCLSNLNIFYQIFKDNPMIDEWNGVKYIKKDYYVLSLYLLLRHLNKYYVFNKSNYNLFDDFAKKFYIRLMENDENK